MRNDYTDQYDSFKHSVIGTPVTNCVSIVIAVSGSSLFYDIVE